MTHKVFVSHASEDKDRFVIRFAEKLRARGIDAWLDKWEMLPGDRLVDKIFEEGIKEAGTVIIVLSEFSIVKPWVREELNASVVKRIDEGIKLIPVVIDKCEVPEALKSTVWIKIDDLTSYDASFDKIIASIFGATDKPPLGPVPKYAESFSYGIGGLNKIDNLVFRLSCEFKMKNGNAFVDPEKIFLNSEESVVPQSELVESLEILDQQGIIS